MKVLVLPSAYPTLDMPTKFIFVKEQVAAMNKFDVDQVIVYVENRSITGVTIRKLIDNHFQYSNSLENAVPIYRKHAWNIIPAKFLIGGLLWIKQTSQMVDKYIKQNGLPNIIHVHCTELAGIVAMKIYKKYKIPYVITEHSPFRDWYNLPKNKHKVYHEVYKHASQVIAVSNAHKTYLSNIFPDMSNIDVISNFIDTDYFKPETFLISTKPTFNFLAVNNLCADKRVDRLLYAFAKAFKNDISVRLCIVGDGDLKKDLIKLTYQLGIQSQVRFTGKIERVEIKKYLSLCDSLVLASDSETFGMVLIEAISMGKPVVSTRSGGPNDIINELVGVFADNSVENLSLSMIHMRLNYMNYSPLKLHDYIVSNFSVNIIPNKIVDLYKNYATYQKQFN